MFFDELESCARRQQSYAGHRITKVLANEDRYDDEFRPENSANSPRRLLREARAYAASDRAYDRDRRAHRNLTQARKLLKLAEEFKV